VSGYDLPQLNAALNATTTVLLLAGYAAIRAKRVRLHMTLMLTALGTSALFLASYLTYHFAVRGAEATRYTGEYRGVYFAVLLSHTVLAAVAAPLVLVTAGLAVRKKFHTHLWVARVTLPIWLYVSVTGVVVFLFLKDLYPTE
jgi:putative membrane protein